MCVQSATVSLVSLQTFSSHINSSVGIINTIIPPHGNSLIIFHKQK